MSQTPNTPRWYKHMTVGSLVRHKRLIDNPVGIVIDHFMWDGYSGGLEVKFLKPYTKGSTGTWPSMSDRYDSWELVDDNHLTT
jgi:hypothetical protein